MIKGATPRAAIFWITGQFSPIFFRRIFRPDWLEQRNPTTQQALTPWEMTVAAAAPCTPMRKPKMNSGSRMMFSTAPMSTEHIAARACPWAVI